MHLHYIFFAQLRAKFSSKTIGCIRKDNGEFIEDEEGILKEVVSFSLCTG